MAESGLEHHLEPGGPQRVVTWRALVAGTICSVFIAAGAPYGCLKLKSATMALDFSLPAAVFTMFVLVVIVNVMRVFSRGRSLLNRGEMLVAFAMMAVSCAVCTMGLTAYLLPMVGTPLYYMTPANRWEEILLPHTPSWLMLPTTGEAGNAIKYFYVGLPSYFSREDRLALYWVWVPTLVWWGIFLLALYASSICLMGIFRKQWVEHERIGFPLAQLPMELAADPRTREERFCPLLKNPMLWIGFAVPFIYCALAALPAYFELLAGMRPRLTWSLRLLQDQWVCHFRLSWQTLGLAYLLSADVGLCLWLFGLLGSLYHGLSKLLAFQSSEKLGIYGAAPYPDLGHFAMGAMIALVALRLWIGRKHLIGVLRKALFMKTEVSDRHEPMSYFSAVWGSVAGAIVMTVWLCLSGFPVHIALLILFAAFVGFVGLTRIIAESGMPVSIVPLISSDFVVSAVGTSAIGRQGLVALPWTYVWNGDVRTFVMCSSAHGMRVCSGRNRTYRGLFGAMMLAVVVSLIASVAMTLKLAYEEGGVNLQGWFFKSGPQKPFEFANRLLQGKARPPNVRGWIATGIGAGAMVLLTLARHRFAWWPVNPVGLPIAVVLWTQYLWFSIFIAWIIKTRVLKYGGPRLYKKLRPMFLGLVLGQYTGAVFWLVVDAFAGVTGNRTFWI